MVYIIQRVIRRGTAQDNHFLAKNGRKINCTKWEKKKIVQILVNGARDNSDKVCGVVVSRSLEEIKR